MNQKTVHRKYIICGVILISCLTAMSYRVISLQWLHRDEQNTASRKSAQYKTELYPAYRGLIVDRNEEPLVVNIPLSDMYADKYHLDDKNLISWGVAYKRLRYTEEWISADRGVRKKMLSNKRFSLADKALAKDLILEHNAFIVSLIAKPLGMTKGELLELLNDPKRKNICIKKNIQESDADYIKRTLKENHIHGLTLKKRLTRKYHSPTLATHLIGYTKDYQGEMGLEKQYNEILSGTDGFHKRKNNPRNLAIYSEDDEFLLPVQGMNVKLTIDTMLQSIVEEELEGGLQDAKAQKGCAIMMDPKTGDILAMAARPHYNLNTREGVATGSSNYIFKTALEPGSTFKVITASTAINEGLVNIHSPLIDCENGYYESGSVVLRDDYPKGKISLTKILATSNNIGTYKVGRQVGKARFFKYLEDYGFGQPTPLNWKGEVKTRAKVGPAPQEFASSTFGYAISATPMHMAIAYSTIANNGQMMRPTIVKSVVAYDGTMIEDHPPKMLRRVLEESTARSLRRALVSVTNVGGTGTRASVPGYKVAGKTGTTRKWENGKYQKNRYICSFGGMMPADNPAFVCYIVVDDPMTTEMDRYGGTLAAPIFSRIATRASAYMEMNPTESISLTEN